MTDLPIKLSLPYQCGCDHNFKIDPTGVDIDTDIVCPSCGQVNHLNQDTVDTVADDYTDAMGDLFEDEDEYQAAVSLLLDAPVKKRAKVVDDGF